MKRETVMALLTLLVRDTLTSLSSPESKPPPPTTLVSPPVSALEVWMPHTLSLARISRETERRSRVASPPAACCGGIGVWWLGGGGWVGVVGWVGVGLTTRCVL